MKMIKRVRFWTWGAMHYERFDQFQILLRPPIAFSPIYFNQKKTEWWIVLGITFPKLYVVEPTYTDIYRHVQIKENLQIEIPEDELPF